MFVPSYAIPQGGQVVGGQATISSSTNAMQINQSTGRAVVNWQSFNIGAQESVNIRQPNSSSIILNRINPNSGVSKIFGALTANGQVWLSNPAGIWIGPGARIDVAGLLATTADINTKDFMAGRFHFVQDPNWNGSIINEGTIKVAQAGLVALVGNGGVVNNGYIEANLGTVVLATGREFTVNFTGNDLISFKVDKDSFSHDKSDGVSNSGVISAGGGKILLASHTASDVLDHSINMGGVVEAKSVGVKNGEIILMGGDGNVKVTGKVDASGKKNQQKGGTIAITGKLIALTDDAIIDASGDAGGGTILIGGDYQGKNPAVANAERVYIGNKANINADAISKGNGGKVILWSDKDTRFYGNISARGGANSGDGGFVETSGKAYLEANGLVDASAPKGKSGSWLLDPANVTITNAVTLNGLFDGLVPNTFTTTANTATANVATIIASLNLGTSVTIKTTPGGAQAGTITLASSGAGGLPIAKILGGSATLTLDAADSITLNNDITSTSGALNVTLISPNAVTINGNITTNGGNFLSSSANASSISASKTIDTGAGTVTFNVNTDGAGANGFIMNAGSAITTTNTTANAVRILVNTAAGGTGTAALRDITTGTGGTITVQTDNGGNTTGGDITAAAGTLNTGSTGTVTLSNPKITNNNIGTSALPIQIIAGTLNATSGSSGIFVTQAGNNTLSLGTIDTSGTTGNAQIFSGVANTTTGGAINQTLGGAITVTTLTARTFNDSGAEITLNNSTNDVTTINLQARNLADSANAAGAISYTDSSAVAVAAANTTSTVGLIAGGALTQTAGITGTTLTAKTLNDTGAAITLSNAANEFSSVDLRARNLADSANAAGAINYRDVSAVDVIAANTLSTVTLTAANTLSQSGSMTGTTLTAKTLNNTGAAITLTDSGNEFTTIDLRARNAADTANVAGALNYRDTTGFAVAAANTTSTIDLTAGDTITQTAAMAGTTLTAKTLNNAGAAITLNNSGNALTTVDLRARNAADTANAAGEINYRDTNAIDIAAANTTSTVTLTAAGAITQSGSMIGSSLTAKTLVNAGAALTFNNASNDFNTIDIRARNAADTANVAGAITYQDANGFDVASIGTTSTVDLTGGNAITQSGSIAGTTLTVKTLNNTGAAITLNDVNNALTTVNLQARNAADTANAAGAINYTDSNSIVIAAANTASTFSLTAGTSITQTGALAVSDTPTFTASAVNTDIALASAANIFDTTPVFTTTGAGTIRDLALRNAAATAVVPTLPTGLRNLTLTFDNAAMVLPAATLTGTLGATANGAITQSGALVVSGVTTLAAGSTNNITLANASNDFSTIGVTNANNVTLRDANALIFGNTTVSGNLDVTSGGALTDTGTIAVTGSTTLASGTANSITLNTATNDFNTVKINSANNVTLVDTNALSLLASIINGTLSTTSTGGLNINENVSTGGTATFTVNTGTFSVADSAALATPNSAISITATDFNLNSTGTISSGNATTTITQNTASGSLALGNTAGTMTISPSELQRITSNAFALNAPSDGQIIVDGINTTDMPNIAGTVTLTATNGTLGSISFVNAASTFAHALTINTDTTLSVADGASAATNNSALSITAQDLNLNSTGTLSSGTATTTITQNTPGGSLALGNTAGTMTISGSELSRIFTNAFSLVAPSDGQIIVDGITVAQTSNIAGTTTLTATAGTLGSVSFVNALSTFSRALTINTDTTVSVGDGATLATNSAALNITAQDLNLNTTGAINSGGATTTITENTASGSIGLGNTAGTMTISGAELSRISANALSLVAPTDGQIIVDGITAGQSANIAGTTTLTATAGTLGSISFVNGFSTFTNALTASTDTTFSVGDGVTAATLNTPLSITALDLNLNTTGQLNAGAAGTINITQNTANNTIGLGNTAGNMTISGSELQRMIASNLNINAPSNGQIIVNGITAANSANISGTVTLTATAGTLGSVVFQTGASTFKALTVNTDDGITIGVNVAANTGNLSLNADVGGVGALLLNSDLSAVGSITLSALTGGITIGAPTVNIIGNGVTFNHTVNGGNVLIVDSGTGTAAFQAIVGGVTPLASLTVNNAAAINTTAITTLGAQNYNGAVTFGANTTLTANAVNFASSIDRDGAARSLTIDTGAGNINLLGNVGAGVNGALGALTFNSTGATLIGGTVAAASLVTNAGGTTEIDGASIATTGAAGQIYNDAVIIGGDTQLSTTNDDITFVSTIDSIFSSAKNLTVNVGTGTLALNDVIGATYPLLSFTVSNTGATNDLTIAHNINTTNNISLTAGRNVILSSGNLSSASGDISLTSTAGAVQETGAGIITGNLLTTNAATGISLMNNNMLNAFNAVNSNGDINFINAATLAITGISQGAGDVTISNTGAMTVSGLLASNGGSINLTTLSPDNNERVMTINANIQTAGGAISLNAANNSSGTATSLIVNNILNSSPGSGGVLTIGGGLALNASPVVGAGNIGLNGNGLDLTIGALNLSTPTTFNLDRFITVTGALTSTSNLSLIGDAAHTGIGGVYIASSGSINSGGSLTLSGASLNGIPGANPNAGVEIVNGASVQAAGDITMTTTGPGIVQLGADVTSQGGTINFNAPLTLTNDVGVDSGLGGVVNFAGDVSGVGKVLTLQNNSAADGDVTFNGNVILAGFTTYAQPYSVIFNGVNNTFSNAVTFNNTDGIVLGNNTSNVFNFNGGLNNPYSTTLAGTIYTQGAQLSLANTVLSGNSSINTQNGAASLAALSGAYSAVINTGSGILNMNGDIALQGALSLYADQMNMNAASMSAVGITLGDVGDAVMLSNNLLLSSNNNALTINASINGAYNLTLNAGGSDINVNSNLGDIMRLGVLTLQSLRNFTSNATIQALSYVQSGANGVTQFNNSGLQVLGNINIAAQRLLGRINSHSLTINLATGNFTGFVNGQTGAAAIAQFQVLNSLEPNKIFFDGIDIYTVFNPPVPVPPVPSQIPLIPAQIVFPTNYASTDSSLYGLTRDGHNKFYDLKQLPDLKNLSGNCVDLGGNITICGAW